jgi:EmrB/QacA subfamily drug resistance transporter
MQRKWWTLIAVSVATFMLLLDITVVNVALPSIREDLGASFTDLQWVVDAYALTLAALVLTAGSLADRLGRRRLFAAGLAIFSVASLLCALAPDPTLLSLARAAQGVGGAVLFAVSLALVAQDFPAGRQRGTAMGLYGATIGVAVAVGPLVGGALTDGLGWRSIFYLNVPVGVAALAVTQLKLRESRDPNATRVDWAGVATFSGALLLLVLALVRGNAEGWGSSLIVSLLAGSATLLVAFIAIQRRVSQPMLPLELFKLSSFTGVQLAAFAVSGSLLAMFLYLSLYLQNYLGYSPLEAGLRYLPITLLAFLFGPIAGALLSRVPARLLLSAGLGMTGVGLLLMSGIQTGSGWTTLLGGFLVAGAGVGLLNPVIADVAVSVVPKQHSGMAAGISDTFRQVGVAVGIAVWGAILVGRGADKAGELVGTPAASGARPRELIEAASSGSLDQALAAVPPQAQQVVSNAAGAGFLAGLNHVLTLAALLSFAGALLALWLIREHEIQRHATEREPETPDVAAAPAIVERLGDHPRAVGRVTSELPVSRPAVSQHLMGLRHAGLLADPSAGDRDVYPLDADAIGALRAYPPDPEPGRDPAGPPPTS